MGDQHWYNIVDSQTNCCIHAGLTFCAMRGPSNAAGADGGANLKGGDCANGIPRNLFTGAVAAGSMVVVPMTMPCEIEAVGDIPPSC